ncbi:hypothetical protein [Candidatus Bealeia paramacronuclearis]|uniref:hypothetical protein n=1 Tax=Candidatus Bealeia paramacronuclearis TaxID=1921001 RepID=UPI0030D32B9F
MFLMGNPQGLDHQAGRDCAHVWRVPYVYQVGNSEKECTTRIFQSKVEAGLLECTETQSRVTQFAGEERRDKVRGNIY